MGRPDSGVPDAVRRHIRIRGPPTGVRGMTRTCIHGSVCVLCILWPPPELPRKGVYWLFTDNFYNSERGVRCKAGSLSQLVSMPVPSVPKVDTPRCALTQHTATHTRRPPHTRRTRVHPRNGSLGFRPREQIVYRHKCCNGSRRTHALSHSSARQPRYGYGSIGLFLRRNAARA